jgi:hypothetical protein
MRLPAIIHPAMPAAMRASVPAKSGRSIGRGRFVLGRERFARISAVEGVRLTAEMQEALEQFDRAGLTRLIHRGLDFGLADVA